MGVGVGLGTGGSFFTGSLKAPGGVSFFNGLVNGSGGGFVFQ